MDAKTPNRVVWTPFGLHSLAGRVSQESPLPKRTVERQFLRSQRADWSKTSARSGSSSLNGKSGYDRMFRVCFRIFFFLPDVQFLIDVANAARVQRVGTK